MSKQKNLPKVMIIFTTMKYKEKEYAKNIYIFLKRKYTNFKTRKHLKPKKNNLNKNLKL